MMNGCGAQQCQGSAASGDPARSAAVAGSPLPVAPAAIPAVESPPAPAAALVPSGGEGSEAAAAEGSGSADEGSGIPPGMPEEGSPAYELLVARLCARLASAEGICGHAEGGTNGDPRTFYVRYDYGACHDSWGVTWTEQPDGSWDDRVEGYQQVKIVEHTTMILRPEIALAARHPSDIEVAAAKAELEKQGSLRSEVEFIDLNHDGQTEFIEWFYRQCGSFREPSVYVRRPDGRWAEDSDAAETYFTQPE
ncbi:MAG: hypothetical protein HQ461_13310 [Deltaproteobacteria bacterium]|nr:hypothetical protein [Deltaproteobacteria bacterium]